MAGTADEAGTTSRCARSAARGFLNEFGKPYAAHKLIGVLMIAIPVVLLILFFAGIRRICLSHNSSALRRSSGKS